MIDRLDSFVMTDPPRYPFIPPGFPDTPPMWEDVQRHEAQLKAARCFLVCVAIFLTAVVAAILNGCGHEDDPALSAPPLILRDEP